MSESWPTRAWFFCKWDPFVREMLRVARTSPLFRHAGPWHRALISADDVVHEQLASHLESISHRGLTHRTRRGRGRPGHQRRRPFNGDTSGVLQLSLRPTRYD